ncbi:hypothetical protein HII12_005147 [Brettanomyces bruxellensis]|uniref:Uncharacterized protein n=1 Tax=Dekkera bruxellensis TaxID=5007 RepID=A0A8H6B6V0_DEKBR|nr:hypothetical protein HII12_005147 [Brettanomyces bruxellensis]
MFSRVAGREARKRGSARRHVNVGDIVIKAPTNVNGKRLPRRMSKRLSQNKSKANNTIQIDDVAPGMTFLDSDSDSDDNEQFVDSREHLVSNHRESLSGISDPENAAKENSNDNEIVKRRSTRKSLPKSKHAVEIIDLSNNSSNGIEKHDADNLEVNKVSSPFDKKVESDEISAFKSQTELSLDDKYAQTVYDGSKRRVKDIYSSKVTKAKSSVPKKRGRKKGLKGGDDVDGSSNTNEAESIIGAVNFELSSVEESATDGVDIIQKLRIVNSQILQLLDETERYVQ